MTAGRGAGQIGYESADELSFLLYACERAMLRACKPLLDDAGLTFTQYIVMRVLWDRGDSSVVELGGRLGLDSGTLTPVLKKLESKGFLSRRRDATDERRLVVSLTDAGRGLEDEVRDLPREFAALFGLTSAERDELERLLGKVASAFSEAGF